MKIRKISGLRVAWDSPGDAVVLAMVMLDETQKLLDDPADLRRAAERLVALAKSQALRIAKLAGLRRQRFGATSESPDQLDLALEETAIELARAADPAAPEDAAETKRKPKRKPLPKELPRTETVLTPGEACADCGGRLKRLGEDITEELDYIPGRFVVNRFVRPRLACSCCEAVCQAPLPPRPIERGRPGPAYWRMCWSASTGTACRSTGRARSSSGTGSTSIARHWPIGSASRRHCWSHWPTPSVAMCWPARRSLPTTRQWDCQEFCVRTMG